MTELARRKFFAAIRNSTVSLRGVCGLLGLIAAGIAASAQSAGGPHELVRQNIASGAARSVSASYELHGTVGQPQAGRSSLATYEVTAGFHRAATAFDGVFASGFE